MKKSAFKQIWLMRIEVKPLKTNSLRNEMDGAFVNVLIPAETKKQAERLCAEAVRSVEFKLINMQEIRKLGRTKQELSEFPELRKLAMAASKTNAVQFSSFHSWQDKETVH